jgi:uncharacterized protein (TIGR02391 family)
LCADCGDGASTLKHITGAHSEVLGFRIAGLAGVNFIKELLSSCSNPADLLSLTPDELAWALLVAVQRRAKVPTNTMAYSDGAVSELFNLWDPRPGSPAQQRELEKRLGSALKRAFKRLEDWDLIEPAEGDNGKNGYLVLTEKGLETRGRTNVEQIRQRNMLQAEMLHPIFRTTIYADFCAARFGDAVFGAFKILETEVRKAARRPKGEVGVELMRIAFNKDNGPLTDTKEKPSQRQALSNLFEGAFGYFRNADAHANREFPDAFQPMQELMLASRLLSIVHLRSKANLD